MVSFPAVRSFTLLSLVDPNPPVGLLQTGQTFSIATLALRFHEAVLGEHRRPAMSGCS